MTKTVPTDYDLDDGFDDTVEICPHCEIAMGTEGGYHGPVYDTGGRRYDHFLDTEPADGPFFCPGCFKQLEQNRREAENESLEAFK